MVSATTKWRFRHSSLVRLLQAMGLVIPYLSVVAPMAIYQVLQEVVRKERTRPGKLRCPLSSCLTNGFEQCGL